MITDVQRRRKLGKLAESKEAESYFVLLICSHSAQPQLSAILIRCPPAWWGWKLDITFWQIDLNNWGQEISWSWRRFFILSLFGLFVLLFEQRHLSLSLCCSAASADRSPESYDNQSSGDDNPRSLGRALQVFFDSFVHNVTKPLAKLSSVESEMGVRVETLKTWLTVSHFFFKLYFSRKKHEGRKRKMSKVLIQRKW